MSIPIVFILGLSGAGKSSLGEYAKEDLKFLHYEHDRTDGVDIIDLIGIRKEWDAYLYGLDATLLTKELRKKAKIAGKEGVILTFSSLVKLPAGHIKIAENGGILTILLDGTDEDCLSSFLKREAVNGRGLDRNWWMRYNPESSELFKKPEYVKYRVQVFEDHAHISREDLIKTLQRKI